MNLLKATTQVGSFTLLSRVLGLVRDILLARFLGAGVVNDALVTAMKLPNLFRRMFAEGAFNAAFVPLYARKIEEDGEAGAARFASEALSALLFLVAIVVVLFQITMPVSLNLVGFGLDRTAEQGPAPYDLAVLYARVTMPYLLLMSLAALLSGMLNTHSRFLAAAFAPVLLNLVLIGVLVGAGRTEWSLPDLALYVSVGMTVSGVLQLGLLILAARKAGLRAPLRRPRLTPGVRRLLVLGVPGVISAGITQINLMASHTIATLQDSAASWLYYSDRLYQLPLGMIGIAMGVALLPALSRQLRAGQAAVAQHTQNRAMELSLLLTLPAAVALFAMPDFLIGGLFQRGQFTATDTLNAAQALRMFALGLPAFVLLKVFTPAFFARENTRTPMIWAGVSAVVNVALGATLFFTVGFWGLALATSVAAWTNVAGLSALLVRSGDFVLDARLLTRLPRMMLASLLMGAALWWAVPFAAPLLGSSLPQDYGLLLAVSAAGITVYALAAIATRAVRPSELKAALAR